MINASGFSGLFLFGCAIAMLAVVARLGTQFRALSIIGGLLSIAGGLWLLAAKAEGDRSLLELMAHGVGFYCIGRGISDLSRQHQEEPLRR